MTIKDDNATAFVLLAFAAGCLIYSIIEFYFLPLLLR